MTDEKDKDTASLDAIRKQYPSQVAELEAQIKTDLLSDIEAMTVAELQQEFPSLVKKLSTPIIKGMEPGSGFILERDDPFGEGTAADYARARGCARSSLPAILPWGDPATIEALKMYLLRARGCGDTRRVEACLAAVRRYAPKDVQKLQGK